MFKHTIKDIVIKIETLKNKKDFDNLFKSGKYTSSNYYKLVYGVNTKQEHMVRFGFVVNKKFGNAVKRNRIKRQLKEIFRSIKEDSVRNMDFVIIVKNAMADIEFSTIKESVINNMNKFMH